MSDPTTTVERARRGALQSGREVRAMFGRIVPRYDLMNRIMTGGRDVAWRKMVARQVCADQAKLVLDAATGTGDLAFALRDAGAKRVVGLDFTDGMIATAVKKAAREQRTGVAFLVGDALRLPFADGSFDACTVGFGLRNMVSFEAALREMRRVLRPGGRFVCLEMTPFRRPILGPLFRVYFEQGVPLVGGILSGDLKAYRYLPRSVTVFPAAHELADLMRTVGFAEVEYQLLAFGTVAIHSGLRSAE
jgi:demethylmenaquinone methyltransferase/2-methoxy-6-polyprenyl-1,4-benzoquinol methylase